MSRSTVKVKFHTEPYANQHRLLSTLLLKIAEMNRHLQRLMNERVYGENALGWPASPAYERSNPSSDDQERLNNALRIIFSRASPYEESGFDDGEDLSPTAAHYFSA
jgi:hypothetical protein